MRRGKRGRGGRGRRGEGRGDPPPSGRPSRHLPAAAVAAVVAAAAALRKPCPVAGHHGNGTAEFRGRRAARPDPRPRERAHLHRECLRSDTHGEARGRSAPAGAEATAEAAEVRACVGTLLSSHPSLAQRPAPRARTAQGCWRSRALASWPRRGAWPWTAEGGPPDSRTSLNCLVLVQIQCPPEYMAFAPPCLPYLQASRGVLPCLRFAASSGLRLARLRWTPRTFCQGPPCCPCLLECPRPLTLQNASVCLYPMSLTPTLVRC